MHEIQLVDSGGSPGTYTPPPAPVATTLSHIVNVTFALSDKAIHTDADRAVTLRTTGPASMKGRIAIY